MKTFLMSLFAASLLLLGSCSDSPDQPGNTQKVSGKLPTVIIPIDQTKPAEFNKDVTYTFLNYYALGQWTIGVHNLRPSFGGDVSFTSPAITGAQIKGGIALSFYSPFFADNNLVISNLSLSMLQDYQYYIPDAIAPLGMIYLANFQVGDLYKVKTFPLKAYYAGNTVSKYTTKEGEQKSYTTDAPIMNFNISEDLTSAELIIYKPKFAEEMPELSRMVVRGLKVVPDRVYGYRITGTDINPIVGEDAHAVEYPTFKFTDIDFHPVNDNLSQGQLTFKVGDRYTATFRGYFTK